MSMDLDSVSTSSGLDQSIKVQTTDNQDVDRAGAGETTWQSTNWTKYNGYYKSHSSVQAVIKKLGMWTIGTGVEGKDKKKTEKIIGWGKDTFSEILDNQIRVKHINGDSYAEIIKDNGKLINLKPLNPGSMIHVVNSQGMLQGYRQENSDGTKTNFELDKIFHLTLNRTADEIHGTGDIESLTKFLDKIKQLDEDMSVMFHRFVVPMIIWKLNTDNTTKITEFKRKEKDAWNKGENLCVPDIAVDFKLLEAGKNGVDPLEWRNKWTEEVVKGGGVPALIMAIESGTTEASSKMVFLAWGMTIQKEQRDIEAQVKLQLGLEIKLPDPPTIQPSLERDQVKDAGSEQKVKKSEVTATLPGNK